MHTLTTPDIDQIIKAEHYRPAVSVIMPFEPKMSVKATLHHSLKIAADRVERELLDNYPREISLLVMHKLRGIIKNLNFNTHKRSIAIFVSPVFEKVLYLDMPVEEKIMVDESFEIRDLVYCKKQLHKFIVLLLSAKESRMYLADSGKFVRIVSNTPESVAAYINDIPEKTGQFSDPAARKEVMMDKFLHHIDNALDIILNAYHLPLFVMGSEKITGHFKGLTRHTSAVTEYIHGNYEQADTAQLASILEPFINDWKKVNQKDLLNKLEEAAGRKKLVFGMKQVWHEAMLHKGRLLVVEKNYMYAAQYGSSRDTIDAATSSFNSFSFIRDAADDVIEKVLENGGDVEFVEDGLLKDYQHIALVQYY